LILRNRSSKAFDEAERLAADFTSKQQVDRMVAKAAEQLGGLHILVNNGSAPRGLAVYRLADKRRKRPLTAGKVRPAQAYRRPMITAQPPRSGHDTPFNGHETLTPLRVGDCEPPESPPFDPDCEQHVLGTSLQMS
jgi:hypothetical protein